MRFAWEPPRGLQFPFPESLWRRSYRHRTRCQGDLSAASVPPSNSGPAECQTWVNSLPPSRGSGYHFPASATFERALRFEESSNEQMAKYLAPAGTPVTTNDSFAPAACGAGSPERLAAIQ